MGVLFRPLLYPKLLTPMSNFSNDKLYDNVADVVPKPLLDKLLSQGFTPFQIICMYKEKALDENECVECGQSENKHTSNCVRYN